MEKFYENFENKTVIIIENFLEKIEEKIDRILEKILKNLM